MKYIDEFRDGRLAQQLAAAIHQEARPARNYRFMEFCGGHTHALARYGLASLLPENVQMIHGPGCPVCVLPMGRVEQAIRLAMLPEVTLCAYGDCLRVPATQGRTLMKARSEGADTRMVYSPLEALALARAKRERQIVFFAIGFETTTPPTAAIILQAAAERLDNFSVLCCHVLTPAAILGILDNARAQKMIDGMIGPAHVSTVIGSASYEFIPARYGKPVVITGFEPLDMLQGILMLIRQTNDGTARVENEFVRAVNQTGNEKAQAISKQCFEVRESFEWRGLGVLPASALAIRSAWSALDAEARFSVPYAVIPDHKACECAAILRGEKAPSACKAFGSVCTPDSPLGACMVSSEGACAASYTYGEARRHHRKPGRQT